MSEKKMACVVVAYNPSTKEVTNILAYTEYMKKIYVIDNSEPVCLKLKQACEKSNRIRYIDNRGNQGVANALNRGCCSAYKNGYEWVLTMDQDSRVSRESYEKLLACLNEVSESIGIVAMSYKDFYANKNATVAKIIKEKLIITSGSTVRLSAWKQIKGFNNKLFIDSVDYDFSLRMNEAGFATIKLQDVYFEHSVGKKRRKNGVITYNYSPIRNYYIIRNLHYMIHRYKNVYPKEISQLKKWEKQYIMSVFKEKFWAKKIKYMIKGYMDYLRGKFGRYTS